MLYLIIICILLLKKIWGDLGVSFYRQITKRKLLALRSIFWHPPRRPNLSEEGDKKWGGDNGVTNFFFGNRYQFLVTVTKVLVTVTKIFKQKKQRIRLPKRLPEEFFS